MYWAAIQVERGRHRAVQNNLTRLGHTHYLPLELRLVRKCRASKAKELTEYPIIPDMVFVEWDLPKINRFLGTKYTIRPVVDLNEVVVRIPDVQIEQFKSRIEAWNDGVQKQYERGLGVDRKARKAWQKMTLETLGSLSAVMFGQAGQEAA